MESIDEKVGRAMNEVQCTAMEAAALICERRRDAARQQGKKEAAEEAHHCMMTILAVANDLRVRNRG